MVDEGKGVPNAIQSVLSGERAWHVETCDVLDGLRRLPDGCVQCCVTSPPYWGLRDYGVDGQLGLEATPSEYVKEMVQVFREVRRVLRDDGTLWLNIGDSYNAYNGGAGPGSTLSKAQSENRPHLESGYGLRCKSLKPKDLVGIPWQLAFALRDDGWYLRSEIIWHKRAPMPESVRDRPTKAHEQVFLLAKSQRYFYDAVAARTGGDPRKSGNSHRKPASDRGVPVDTGGKTNGAVAGSVPWEGSTANLRTVWPLSPESYSGAHFAVMPTELARRCLLAGTSERGACVQCGTPWKRQTEKERVATRPGTNSKVNRASSQDSSPYEGHSGEIVGNRDPQRHTTTVRTTGWQPGCECGTEETLPCVVLDPFNGAGTTGVVARRLGLRYIGLELNPEYAELSRQRIREDQPLFNTGAKA